MEVGVKFTKRFAMLPGETIVSAGLEGITFLQICYTLQIANIMPNMVLSTHKHTHTNACTKAHIDDGKGSKQAHRHY